MASEQYTYNHETDLNWYQHEGYVESQSMNFSRQPPSGSPYYGYGGAVNPAAGYSNNYSGFDSTKQSVEYSDQDPSLQMYAQNYPVAQTQPSFFTPADYTTFDPTTYQGDAFENEPPLLEELGINFDHIRQKTLAVLNPLKETDPGIMQDTDMAGPLVFILLFGACLLLSAKIHFNYIYGMAVIACLGFYSLLNLMTSRGISLGCTVSVLGYCMLPLVVLTAVSAVFSLQGVVGAGATALSVFWCSTSASKLFVCALDMEGQRLLIAYPCVLTYGVFSLLSVF